MKQYLFRAIPLILACCMFVFVLSPSASASTVSYLDLDPNITVDGDNNLIRLYVPSEYWSIHLRNSANDILTSVTDGDVLSYWLEEGKSYRIDVYFFRNTHFSVKGLPDDTRITISWNSEQGAVLLPSPSFMQETWYFDSSGNEVSWSGATPVSSSYQGEVSFDWYIMPESVPNASSMAFGGNFSHGTAVTSGTFNYWIEYVLLEFSISSFLVSQQMTGQNTEILNDVKNQLAEQGKTLDEFVDQQQQTNEKLDELPGQIGDEMQEVLDQEKEDANNTGNGSIDDMIELIPDYSTGLIQGIENLAGSLGYEGTECKLTMPALRIPALPGVTPAPITFMEEQEVDFEEWFNRMPSEIMAVTKAMFDIAVVIFCFIEFYDLISQLSNGAKRLEKE